MVYLKVLNYLYNCTKNLSVEDQGRNPQTNHLKIQYLN